MGLGWPAAVLGLVAAGVPLLIHLLQRGEYRRIEFAATRFLSEHRRLRWRRLKITQAWLLALRLLLVVLCVLLLAEPYGRGPAADRGGGGWTLVSPRIDSADARTLAPPDAELRWLAPGFPLVGGDPPAWRPGANWSLLAEADAQAPPGQPLRVVAPGDAAGLSTTRHMLSRPVEWIRAPFAEAVSADAARLELDIVVSAARRDDAARMRRALAAWQDIGLRVSARVVPDTDARLTSVYTVWLSDLDIPADPDGARRIVVTDQRPATQAAQVIDFDATGAASVLEQRIGPVTVRTSVKRLDADNPATGDDNFARWLLALLLDRALVEPPPHYPVAAALLAPRVLDAATARASVRRPWTAALVLLVLGAALAERLASAWTMGQRRDT